MTQIEIGAAGATLVDDGGGRRPIAGCVVQIDARGNAVLTFPAARTLVVAAVVPGAAYDMSDVALVELLAALGAPT